MGHLLPVVGRQLGQVDERSVYKVVTQHEKSILALTDVRVRGGIRYFYYWMRENLMTIKPDAYEQLTLELINQARMDPGGEYARLITNAATQTAVTPNITNAIQFFGVDLNVLANQFNQLVATAPLAWSDQLSQSATTHSQLMIDNDLQSHNLPGEPGLGDRVKAAGFQFQTIGENIFLSGQDALYSHAAFFIDWGGAPPTGIQTPAGHRNNIMDAAKKEIGIGVIAEGNPATQAGPNVITQHIGTSLNAQQQLLGVVINDTDNDDFYDIGEGVAGVTVTATGAGGTFTTTTWDSGGYQMALANGTYTVTFTGANVNKTSTVTINNNNLKLDAETGGAVTPATKAQLFAANPDTAKGLAAAYEVLLAGVPNEAGFTFLINNAVSSNFGAGPGVTFNQENIFINLVNNLVQGNAGAKARFDTLATGTTLQEKVTSLYNALIPASKQSTEGLAFIIRDEGLAFYQNVAAERGVAGTDGAAIVSLASLLKIVVTGDYGIGNAVNDLTKAVAAGSDALPATGTTLTALETADGTAFDADDATALAVSLASSAVYVSPTDDSELAFASSVSLVGIADAHNGGLAG